MAEDERKTAFLKIEDGFEKLIPSTATACCCGAMKVTTGVKVICVVMLTWSAFSLMNTGARIGAPCFHFWEHTATMVTFIFQVVLRLLTIPVAAMALKSFKSPREAHAQWMQTLFGFLLAGATLLLVDLAVVGFEVNDVCKSKPMRDFNTCQYEWGKYHIPVGYMESKPADIAQFQVEMKTRGDDGHHDGWNCCQPGDKTLDFVCKGSACEVDVANGRCKNFVDDSLGGCQLFSDIYDVLLGCIFCAMVIYFAHVVNSYRKSVLDGTPDANATE